MMIAGCTPTAQKDAALIQSDLNAVTPAVTEGVDIGLTITGNSALVPLNNTLSGVVQNGQNALLNQLKAQAKQTNPIPPPSQ